MSGELHLANSGRLTAGVDLTNPPYGYTDPNNGTPTGFEVDLVRAVAKAMQLKLTILNRAAPSLLPAVLARRVDIGAASFRDDGIPPPDVCRSAPYMDADLAVVVPAANASTIKSVDDIAGKRVAVVRDSAGARWATQHLEGAAVVKVDTADDVFGAVRSAGVDAAVVDRPVALRTQTAVPQVRAVATVKTDAHYTFLGAVETSVMAPVDTALRTLQSDGTLDDLKRRWFGPGL